MKSLCIILFIFFTSLLLLGQTDSYSEEISEHRNELNEEFLDYANTPLIESDIKLFKGLFYFAIDSTYKVTAIFTRTPDEDVFNMKTSTERMPEYVKYGEAEFDVKGKKLKLNVYQNVKLTQNEEYKDYLFIPFRDFTSGETTYGGGRFMDVNIPKSDTIIIDFNKAYNPYCAYNHKYSCPIPPLENTLETEINAGEKSYSNH